MEERTPVLATRGISKWFGPTRQDWSAATGTSSAPSIALDHGVMIGSIVREKTEA